MTTATKPRRPELKTPLPGPKTRAILEADAKQLSTSYTRPYPFVPDHGEGVWLTDPDGNTLLDFFAGIAVSTTGHAHPHVVKAVQEQVAKFTHVCLTDYPQEITTSLAERLVKHVERPGEKWRVFFGNSGAEAVEAAVKLARYHTGRSHIVSFLGSFHGRTYGAVTLTGSKTKYRRGFGPLLPDVSHIPYPDPFRPPLGAAPESCGRAVLNYLEETLFHTVLPPDEVAAIIVEPMQGEGGYIVPPADFLPGLRALCDRHGILLIYDEVQCGMGRTGQFFGYQHFQNQHSQDCQPDIVTLAKGIASGLPISAMLAKESVMTWPPGSHGSTFGGNPVAAAAAHATLDLLEGVVGPPGGLMRNAAEVGGFLLSELRALQADFPFLGDVRGEGLFIGLEFVKADGAPDGALRDQLSQSMFRRGLLNLDCGEAVIRVSPPLILTREEARVGLDIVREAFEGVRA